TSISSIRGTYLVFVPCSIQAPSASRSACVIPVWFPIGITLVRTATCSINVAWERICEAVSKTMPFGGESTFVGCAEWQGTHRAWTIACARVNGTAVPPEEPCGRITTATAAIASAAVTGIHHAVRPVWRRLKKCRTQAPTTSRTMRISHEYECPYVIGKWLLIIVNTAGSVR